MKKFYVLMLAVLSVFGHEASAQTYTALFSGNWSDPSVWGASGIPSNPCDNCTITINDQVIMTVDVSFTMTGNSKLTIGSAGTNAAIVTIPATNSANISTGHNINLKSNGTGNPNIKILSAISILAVSKSPATAGTYDGVFIQNGSDFGYVKILGYKPILISSDGSTVTPPTFIDPVYKTSLPNAEHPAPFTLNGNGTLPITLASFNASANDGVVSLSWSTTQEVNSAYFFVQRSSDATNWDVVGTVNAKGNSDVLVNYSFKDETPTGNTSYYRLLMMDRDGRYKYSPVKAVQSFTTTGLKVFPNPTSNFINISIGREMSGDLTVKLLNQSGQILHERKLSHAGGTTVTIPVQNYPQGNYILQTITADGKRQARNFVITR